MDTTTPHTTPIAYRTSEVLRILGGIDRSTLWKLEQRGLIKPVPGLRRNKIFAAKEIERFLAGGRAN